LLQRELIIQHSYSNHPSNKHSIIMSYRTAALLLLAAATATTAASSSSTSLAFVSGPNSYTRRASSTATAKQQSKQKQLTPLFVVDPTDFVPVAVFAGAVAVTIYQQQHTVKNAIGAKDDATVTAPTPAATPVAKAPAPAPAPVVAPVAVAPKPVPAPVPAPVAVAPKPAPKPAPAAAPKPAPAPAKKDLVREFGSTIEDRKETEKVVQENKAKAAAKAEAKHPKQVKAAATTDAVDPVPAPVDVTSTTTTSTKKSGSKRRKAWRVVKKVVAPWRKWETIK
jgi:hypothetical protein